jgi:hypothetical protein
MASIPVPSSEPANAVTQSTFYNQIVRDGERVAVLEKSGNLQTNDILVQSVTNGDTTHAPSGDAVFDALATVEADAQAYTDAKTITNTASLNFPSVGAFLAADLTITVTGAATGDSVALGPPSGINAGFLWSGYVSAANTVTVRVYNLTGVAIDPPAQTWRATVFK